MTLYLRSSETLHSEVGNDIVALNVEHGLCYGMENVTAEVWKLLEVPMTIDQLCEQLCSAYEVDPATCATEIASLIATMKAEGLVDAFPVGAT